MNAKKVVLFTLFCVSVLALTLLAVYIAKLYG